MAKRKTTRSGNEWRLPSNVKALILMLIKLFMWIWAASYIVGFVILLIAGGRELSLISFIYALVIIVVGNIIAQLVDKYL